MNENIEDSDSQYSEDSSEVPSSSIDLPLKQRQNDSTELVQIGEHTLRLPKELCENSEYFQEFFSMETWQELPPNLKEYLKNKLPHFPSHCSSDTEQEITLKMLFNNEIIRFGQTPLEIVQKNLEDGNYRPDIIKLHKNINKSRQHEQQYLEWERIGNLAKSLLISREKLLRKAYSSPPGGLNNQINRIVSTTPKLDNTVAAIRGRKRYQSELVNLTKQLGIKDLSDNEDEFEDDLNSNIIKNEEKPVATTISINATTSSTTTTTTTSTITTSTATTTTNTTTTTTTANELKIIGTMAKRGNKINGTTISCNPSAILDDKDFKQMLRHHKKRKLEESDRQEFETNDIRIVDLLNRVEIAGGKDLRELLLAPPKPKKLPVASTIVKNQKYYKMEQKQQSLLRNDLRATQAILNSNQNLLNKKLPTTSALNNRSLVVSQMPQDLILSSSSDEEINVEAHIPSPQPIFPHNFRNSIKSIQTDNNVPQPKKPENSNQTLPQSQIQTQLNIEQPHSQTTSREQILLKDSPQFQLHVQQEAHASLSTSQFIGKKRPHYSLHTSTSKASLKKVAKDNENSQRINSIDELDNLDIFQLPVELNEDILNTAELALQKVPPPSAELMQDTHTCFLSLIRDIFCSTQNHRMKLDELKGKIYHWLSNPITALNDWYPQAENWLALIPSAIYFLSGEFLDQPDEFVPYIEYKPQQIIYQWIGAGRDSDNRLLPLCQYWLSRRNEMGTKPNQVKIEAKEVKKCFEGENSNFEQPISPPPPLCSTSWQVQPALPEEVAEFRVQEQKRFENPHKAFTYRMHGFESVVGPVKGVYTQTLHLTKPRGHNTLLADRPNFVTILTLVRDATARLPNGEGTRAEICELLKMSQYISPEATDNVIHTIVSGALDRMHTENDPCVRYDAKRKIWIYLHRNRTEEEFEKLHQLTQGVSKSPKKQLQNRRIKQKIVKVSENSILIRNNVPTIIQNSQHPPPLIVPTSLTQTVITKASGQYLHEHHQQPPLPALSSIQQNPIKNNLLITAQKTVLLKPELVPIQQITSSPIIIDKEQSEFLDLNEPPPFILQKPLNFQQKTAISPPLLKKVDNKIEISPLSIKTSPRIQNPIIENKNSILSTSLPQQILASPTLTKKLSPTTSKTVIIQSPQQTLTQVRAIPANTNNANILPVVQQQQQQSYILPINSEQIQIISSLPGNAQAIITTPNQKLLKNPQTQQTLPALTSTVLPRPLLVQQGKNIIRVTQNKTLSGQQQKLATQPILKTSPSPSSVNTIRPQFNQQKQQTVTVIGNATIRPPTQINPTDQKQLVHNIVQQQKIQQRLVTTNVNQNALVIANSNQQQIQGKIIQASPQQQQQVQKLINVSGQNILGSTDSSTSNSGNLLNSQIIQIHQPSGTKIQSINANMLQSIRLPNAQHSLIIKPQQVAKAPNTTPTKTLIGGNFITSPLIQGQKQPKQQYAIVQTSQQQPIQTITRVVKSTPNNNTTIQQIQRSQTTGNPVKVLTSSSGQIISLESLLQKQGLAPGTTIRVGGGNAIKTFSNSPIQQYAVVSQARNIVSSTGPQQHQSLKLLTTQASIKPGTATTNVISNFTTATLNTQKSNNNTIGVTIQPNQKIIASTNQLTTPHHLIGTKIIGKPGGIRMLNASNLNLSGLQGSTAKQVLIGKQGSMLLSNASGSTQNPSIQSGGQNLQILQTNASGNIVIGGQTIKMQGNLLQSGNIHVINQQAGQPQAVMLGNQIIKVASSQQTPKQHQQLLSSNLISSSENQTNSIVSNALNNVVNSSVGSLQVTSNLNQPQQQQQKTVVLTSVTGQTIRLQSPSNDQLSANSSATTIQNQQVIIGTPIKSGQLKTAANPSSPNQRVVLVQGNSQILLPSGFQGSAINLKNLKVVSIGSQQQQQQLNKKNSQK